MKKISLSLLLLISLISPSFGQTKKAEITSNPNVNGEEVTIKIKVNDENDRPVMGLSYDDFELFINTKADQEYEELISVDVEPENWLSPEENEPSPAWIIVLLDMSGSMNNEDSQGTRKIDGAIQAVGKFTELASERGDNTQVAIVPFGEKGEDCEGYRINKDVLNKFFLAGDIKLNNNLKYLESLEPCAATDLYNPLKKTIKFLSDRKDTRFYPLEEDNLPTPRLSIILLSDGYHNRTNAEEDYRELTDILRSNNQIVVHTLGYGFTPEELAIKYNLNKPTATRQDIGVGEGKVPESEFVDRDTLAEIAKLGGGIGEFSGDAEEIAENLQLFLNSLLGEYQITYIDPQPDRGAKHEVKVAVQSIQSENKSYTITNFGRSLPLKIRVGMMIIIFLILGVGGIIPFYYWGKNLKLQTRK